MRRFQFFAATVVLLASLGQAVAQSNPSAPSTKTDGILERILEELIKLNDKVDKLDGRVQAIDGKIANIPSKRAAVSVSLGTPTSCGSGGDCSDLAKKICREMDYQVANVAAATGSNLWAVTCRD